LNEAVLEGFQWWLLSELLSGTPHGQEKIKRESSSLEVRIFLPVLGEPVI
jgi:hypothetical protein